jgi:HemY protein
MIRVLGFLIAAALVIAAAFGLASIPGSISGDIGSLHLDAPISIAAALLIAVFVVLYVLVRLVATILRLPGRFGAAGELRRRRNGDRAITRALLALAAGEDGDARREATKARRLLGPTTQTLLIAAEADRQGGRLAEAEASYEELAARKDAKFLGLRGLIRLSVERNDYNRARELVDEAEKTRPDTTWVKAERLSLATRTEDWTAALPLARTEDERAAFATAAALVEPDHAKALKLAKSAHKLAPALAPAALAYARILRQDWNENRALAVLRETWTRAPHPQLGDAAIAETADPLQKVKIATSFTAKQPDTTEAHLLMARVSLEAGMLGEARRHVEAARLTGGNQRRILSLLADIAERDPSLSEPERRSAHTEALRALAEALPDPTWRCGACATEHADWTPLCPSCRAPGRLAWTVRPSTALVTVPQQDGRLLP